MLLVTPPSEASAGSMLFYCPCRDLVVSLSQAERHPSLKDAPLQGSYARDLPVRHKPFNEPIRDVQCLRCGEW